MISNTVSATLNLVQSNLLYLALGTALILMTLGVFGLVSSKDRRLERMRALAGTAPGGQASVSLSRSAGVQPSGMAKSFMPQSEQELSEAQFQLASIGFDGRNAVRSFFLIRLCLALSAPVIVGLSVLLAGLGMLPQALADRIDVISTLGRLQICAVGAAVGFYGPAYWLKSRVTARKDKIRQGFPNTLDLLQISVEAGMGFDAALARVGAEIGRVSPEIAYELLLTQHEIQAGRDRDQAMTDMARRMGIPEAMSFVTVIAQSLQFGTSLTAALRVYATEMREKRELAAQEKANKLPVHMSAVMSIMMLPALFLITLTPIIIRYTAIF